MENQLMLSYTDGASTSSSVPAQQEDPYLPPGYRFVPTDEELIMEYLVPKVNFQSILVKDIHAVNLYQFSPHYFAEHYPQLGEKEWYFFTPRDRKYPNGSRPKRSVEGVGFWKATGADKAIHSNTGELVGKKKVLVFYLGKPKTSEEKKTNWIMHEYKLNKPSRKPGCNDMKLDDWVLCRVYDKPDKPEKPEDPDKPEKPNKPKKSTKKRKSEATPINDGNIIMAPTPLAVQKQECANDVRIADGHGEPGNYMIMAPPLAEDNKIAAGGNQEEAGPIDNSPEYKYPGGISSELATILMAEARPDSFHDPVGEMIYAPNHNIDYDYDAPYQMTCPLNVQHQWPPLQQEYSWGTTTQNSGNSFKQDISNFIERYSGLPELQNVYLGGQGDGTPRMGGRKPENVYLGGQGDGPARMGGQGNGTPRMGGRKPENVYLGGQGDGPARMGGQGDGTPRMGGQGDQHLKKCIGYNLKY